MLKLYNEGMQQFSYGKTTYGDHPVDEYISTLSGAEKEAVRHVYEIARKLAPEAEQAISYGMPCLKYKGKGLVSAMATKKFLSLYPFIALERVISLNELAGFETTTGSVHFSPEHPLPDSILSRMLTTRIQQLDL